MSWFDVRDFDPQRECDLFYENIDVYTVGYQIQRFRIVDFGSTRLGVESADSDLDLLITTYDCLFERLPFFQKLESKIK